MDFYTCLSKNSSSVRMNLRKVNMQKVRFYYDYQKDAWSWVFIAKDKTSLWGLDKEQLRAFIPVELLREISKKNRQEAEKLVSNYLKNHPKKKVRAVIIKEQIKALSKCWESIEDKFLVRLAKITQTANYFPSFKCYITTGFICPYNEKEGWFMVSFWHGLPKNIMVVAHEIFHLHFLRHYKKYCQKFLNKEQIEDLKEAITFILNTDFGDLILVEDPGYPAHQKLRRKLEREWRKEKDFKKFLDKAIKIVKSKNYA